jgi:anti-sigma regulatory factor (Ser/Thr protein kinase)
MNDGLPRVEVGVCVSWPLPADATCAGSARHLFRRAAEGLSLDTGLIDDGVTMVSELAANTRHARCEPGLMAPELWLYLRGRAERRELICKVFDSYQGWPPRSSPFEPGRAGHRVPADATSGRGLEVVHALSHGRWGCHLTRARLGGWAVRGKVVWFALPAADKANNPNPLAGRLARMTASEAMTELEAGFAARGLEDKVVRTDDPGIDMAVLSVCSGLTVWCRDGLAWLCASGVSGQHWGYGDLIEVAEQVVQAYETLSETVGADDLAGTTRTGRYRSPAASSP